jgi:hypothetical protein
MEVTRMKASVYATGLVCIGLLTIEPSCIWHGRRQTGERLIEKPLANLEEHLTLSNAVFVAIRCLREENIQVPVHFDLLVAQELGTWSFSFASRRETNSYELAVVLLRTKSGKSAVIRVPARETHFVERNGSFLTSSEALLMAMEKALTFITERGIRVNRHEFLLSVVEAPFKPSERWHLVFRFAPYEIHAGVAVLVNADGRVDILTTSL